MPSEIDAIRVYLQETGQQPQSQVQKRTGFWWWLGRRIKKKAKSIKVVPRSIDPELEFVFGMMILILGSFLTIATLLYLGVSTINALLAAAGTGILGILMMLHGDYREFHKHEW